MNFQFAQQGASFAGAMAYYCHDKREAGQERQPQSAERVAWSETRNMLTDRAETATQIMIATAERASVLKERAGIAATGRKATKPVAAFSLAWHPDEAGHLDRAEMVRVADQALKVMGLEHCQSVIIAHRDTKHPHVHVVVNRVNPETGRMEKIDPNRVRALDRWAHEYERERGQIYSPERAAKYERMDERRKRHPDKEDRTRHIEERRQRSERSDRRQREETSTERQQRSKDQTPTDRRERGEGRKAGDELGRQRGADGKERGERPDREERAGGAERPAERAEGREADNGGREDAARAQSPAQALRERSAALTQRHAQEWRDLGRGFAQAKTATYAKWRAPLREVEAQLKTDAKPLWREQFAEERQSARDRQRLERSFGGRLGLSVAAVRAAREVAGPSQDRSFLRQVLAHFISRDLREATFAQAAARDRATLGQAIREVGDARIGDVKAERTAELAQVRETYASDRAALSERQGGERRDIRAAWREISRERGRAEPVRERGRDVPGRGVGDRADARGGADGQAVDRIAHDPAGRMGDRADDRALADPNPAGQTHADRTVVDRSPQPGSRDAPLPEPARDAPQPEAKPSKFGWLDQRQQRDQETDRGSKFDRSQDAQERGRDRDRDRDRDWGDRER